MNEIKPPGPGRGALATGGPAREAILVVAPWPYHPTCGIGGGVVCFQELERLAGEMDIHFLSFDQVPHDIEAGRRALGRICASVTLLPAPQGGGGMGDRIGQLTQVWTRRPREVRGTWSEALAAAITHLVAAHAPVAVLLQFPQMAQYTAAASGAPVVMDVQDACMVSRWREWRAMQGRLRRAVRFWAWLAWSRYELHWYAQADALLAFSENDLGALRSFLPEVPTILSPVAAGVTEGPVGGGGSYVGFIGNFGHAPNRDALDWLLDEIWPRVRDAVPDAALHIAGPEIPERARAQAAQGVVVRGFVDSVGAFHAGAALSLVPYRFGGGTKIKALEAMAQGCPVVATTVGAEGLRATPGVEIRVADDAAGFAEAVVALLRSPEARRAQAEAARAHIARHFSWEAKAAALREALRTARARQSGQALPA